MMAKKQKDKQASSLVIPKRQAGKVKTNYMQNLRPFPVEPHPIQQDLDAQNSGEVGRPNTLNLDAQNLQIGRPTSEILDAQAPEIGRPNAENLGTLAPKKEIRTPKQKQDLGAQTPKNKNLDTQTSAKTGKWTKYEKNRSTGRISLRPNADILKRVRLFCVENDNMDVSTFFEMAAIRFMDLDAQNKNNLGALAPSDERRLMITWKTTATVINLYLRYNLVFNPNTKWKPRDDEAAFSFNDVDLRIIELGIIQAQTNKFASDPNGTINSFKFYINEISTFERLNMDGKMLDVMLEVNRRRWREITGREIDLSFLEEGSEK